MSTTNLKSNHNLESQSDTARSLASFIVEGTALDFEAISNALELSPSHTHRAGDPIFKNKKDKVYDHDMWSLHSPLTKHESLDTHIKWLAEKLKPHYASIKSLKQNAEVYIYCGYTFHDFESNLSISPEALSIFSDLGVPMEISLLVHSLNE